MARVDFSTRTVFLSVRELANFLTPKFSNLVEFSPTQINALQLGLKWHQKIQEEYLDLNTSNLNRFCLAETFVSKTIPQVDNWTMVIRGRIDLISFDIE